MKHLSFVNVTFGRVWGEVFVGGQNVLSSFPLRSVESQRQMTQGNRKKENPVSG